jgi:uncharacterized protein
VAGPSGRITVRVQPRATSPGLVRVDADDTVRLRLASPPAEGRANAEACERMAKLLGVAKSKVRMVSGASGRTKVLEVVGMTADEALARLRG